MTTLTGQCVTVVVEGTPFTVEVGDLMAWPLWVTVNGVPYRVEIEPVPPRDPVAQSPDEVTGGGECNDMLLKATLDVAPGEPLAVRAPMPGLITAIHVSRGDRVTAGQALCTLEAMKMRNAIRAPRSGLVADVTMEAGRTVGCGDVLVTLT